MTISWVSYGVNHAEPGNFNLAQVFAVVADINHLCVSDAAESYTPTIPLAAVDDRAKFMLVTFNMLF